MAFAKAQLQGLPPEQWVFALQTFYSGLKQAARPVRPTAAPLRSGSPAGGNAAPQNMQEAMFSGL